MTLQDINKAMMIGSLVVYDGAEYTVNAIIKRQKRPLFAVEVELLDKCGHSVVIVRPEKIKERPPSGDGGRC